MGGFWFWQYSLAMVIVLAALLDSVWWVPAHQHGARRAVPAAIARCHGQ